MAAGAFTLSPGQWYVWEMFPGYSESFQPYYSPIYILGIKPLKSGTGTLKVHFVNLFYAEGVREVELTLRGLHRATQYLIADLGYDERCAAIGELSDSWMLQHAPELMRAYPGRSAVQVLTEWSGSDQYPLG